MHALNLSTVRWNQQITKYCHLGWLLPQSSRSYVNVSFTYWNGFGIRAPFGMQKFWPSAENKYVYSICLLCLCISYDRQGGGVGLRITCYIYVVNGVEGQTESENLEIYLWGSDLRGHRTFAWYVHFASTKMSLGKMHSELLGNWVNVTLECQTQVSKLYHKCLIFRCFPMGSNKWCKTKIYIVYM